jgi:hypothetical protein
MRPANIEARFPRAIRQRHMGRDMMQMEQEMKKVCSDCNQLVLGSELDELVGIASRPKSAFQARFGAADCDYSRIYRLLRAKVTR